jgi:glutamyl-tRNA synthetase
MGKVITAFPPEPSKFPHIGHAKAALVNYLYAKKYKGKFILRFEDTNPELAKKEYYKAIIDGLKWLKIKWNKIDYISDHIPKYYKVVENLIRKNYAYVCLCKQKKIKENRRLKRVCKHRFHSVEMNLKLWNEMLRKTKEGKAVVRLKIDMKHKNAAMRDPTIMRIIDAKHPRVGKKYRVWPLYDFGTAMMDVWEKITHRIRSKEFEMHKEVQQYIQKILGYKPPVILEMGRLNIKGAITQGRVIRDMIKSKKLLGWDDPRLTTLIALKRRGFVPEAIKEFLISTGITKAEAKLEWKVLEAFNRKFIDPVANRYFAVLNPVKISIDNIPEVKEVKAPLHPNFPRRGYKRIPVNKKIIYIEKVDLKKLKNKIIGLAYFSTVKLNKKSEFVSKKIKSDLQKIQWVSEPNVRIKILMSDGRFKNAIAEPEIKNVKVNQIIQLVRIGFCRVDKKTKREIILYYAHK